MVPVWALWALAGLSFGYSYIQAQKAKKAAKKAAESARGFLFTKSGINEGIPVVYGTRRVGGIITYSATSGDSKHSYLYLTVVLSEGEVESISNIEIDNVPFTNDLNVLTNPYVDCLVPDSPHTDPYRLTYFEAFSGSDTQAPVGITMIKENMVVGSVGDKDTGGIIAGHEIEAGEDTNFRVQGCACLTFRMYIPTNAKFNHPYSGGTPNITAIVKGKKIYDPRLDSTNGGSGTHRSNDPSTWAWSNNAALCLRDYLTSERYGKNLSDDQIDDVAFAAAANDLDAFTVTPYSGGDPVELFECNAAVDTNNQLFDNVEDFLINMRGFLPYVNGKYSLGIDQKITGSNFVTYLDESHIIGAVKLSGSRKDDKYNQVSVRFPDAALNYEENEVIWPDPSSSTYTTITSATAYPDGRTAGSSGHLTEAQLSDAWIAADGELLTDDVDAKFITNYYAARDIARLFCLRSRFNTKLAVTVSSEALDLTCGDVVHITHRSLGWDAEGVFTPEGNGYFQVDSLVMNKDGTVEMSLIEFHNSIYTYDPATVQSVSTGSPKGGTTSLISPENVMDSQVQASLGWTFAGTDHAWYYNNMTQTAGNNYLTIEATAADPYMTSPTIAVSGALAPLVIAKIRRTGGSTWDGSVTYSTQGGHAIDYANYRCTISSDPTVGVVDGDWVTVVWDMQYLTVGGTDWTDSIITAIELHLGSSIDDDFEIEYVTVGFRGVSVTQINSDNVQYFIGDLAVNTLQIADNAVTVPEVDVDATTYVGDGSTYNATASVDVTLPADGTPISLWWAIEHGYPSYPTTGGWQYKIKRDGTVIDSRLTTMVAPVDFMTGLTVDTGTSTAGTTHTYTLEWWGQNSNIQLESATLFALGAAK